MALASNLNGWVVGYGVGAVVVVLVALLLLGIIMTVHRIRAVAQDITRSLVQARDRTEVLWAVADTKATVDDITGMAAQARAALGG